MRSGHTSQQPDQNRRDFLKRSGVTLTTAALASAITARVHAGENNTINVALIGCGGRGTGAALNALSTAGPIKLVAMADAFDARLQSSYNSLSKRFGEQVDVPPDRRFVGLAGFRQAIDCLGKGDLVLLAAPPAFRPQHLEYAVQKDCHVFMEKSFAVDGMSELAHQVQNYSCFTWVNGSFLSIKVALHG